MQSKLTLSMEKELIDFAHQIARKSNVSISQIFRSFLLNIKNRRNSNAPRHEILRNLYGITASAPILDKKSVYKKLYQKHA